MKNPSPELQVAITSGKIELDVANNIAKIFLRFFQPDESDWQSVLGAHNVLGLTSELELRHGYRVTLVPRQLS